VPALFVDSLAFKAQWELKAAGEGLPIRLLPPLRALFSRQALETVSDRHL
jgi:hypothetical protein